MTNDSEIKPRAGSRQAVENASSGAAANAPLPVAYLAFQRAQDRLGKHFEPHLPQGPESAPARLAVFDYVSENRRSILADGAPAGSGHHDEVNATLRAIGAEKRLAPDVIKTGARLFEARDQVADRFLMKDVGAPVADPEFASTKARYRLDKHFDSHLPQDPYSAVARQRALDYINSNRSSILADGAPSGSTHHTAVNAQFRAIGIYNALAPDVIKTGARLYEAGAQATERAALQSANAQEHATWPDSVRKFEDNNQKLSELLTAELPRGPRMDLVRRDTVQAIKDNRFAIAQNGAPVGSNEANAVWLPVVSRMVGDPQTSAYRIRNTYQIALNKRGSSHVQHKKLRPAKDFVARIARDHQNHYETAAPAQTPAQKYPLMASDKIRDAAVFFIEREQLANRALAGIASGRDAQAVSSAESDVLGDPRLAALDRASQRASQSGNLDVTQSDYDGGKILAQKQDDTRQNQVITENILPATLTERSGSTDTSSDRRQSAALSNVSFQSDISDNPGLRQEQSPGIFSNQSPLVLKTVTAHATGTAHANAASPVDSVRDALDVTSQSITASNRDEVAGTLPRQAPSPPAIMSRDPADGSTPSPARTQLAAHFVNANATEQALQELFGQLPSLSQEARPPAIGQLLPEPGLDRTPSPAQSNTAHGKTMLSPTAGMSGNDGDTLMRSPQNVEQDSPRQQIEDLVAATLSPKDASISDTSSQNTGRMSIRSSQIPSVPPSSDDDAAARQSGDKSVGKGVTSSSHYSVDSDFSIAPIRDVNGPDKRARPEEGETDSNDRGQKRARVEDSGASAGMHSARSISGNSFVASQAEEVSDRNISEPKTESEGSDRSVSDGSQSRESSDSWVSGASSDPDWKPVDGAVARAEQRLQWQAAAMPAAELRTEALEQLDLRLDRPANVRANQEQSQSSQSSGYQGSGESSASSSSASNSNAATGSQSQRSADQSNSAARVNTASETGTSSASDSRSGLMDSQAVEDNRSYKSESMERPSHYSSVGSDGWRSGLASTDSSYRPSVSELRHAGSSSNSSASGSPDGVDNVRTAHARTSNSARAQDRAPPGAQPGRAPVPDRPEERSRARGRS
jgi:hypothetical protein